MNETKEPKKIFWSIVSGSVGYVLPLQATFFQLEEDGYKYGRLLLKDDSIRALKAFLTQRLYVKKLSEIDYFSASRYLERYYYVSNVVITQGSHYSYKSNRWLFRSPSVSDDYSVLYISGFGHTHYELERPL